MGEKQGASSSRSQPRAALATAAPRHEWWRREQRYIRATCNRCGLERKAGHGGYEYRYPGSDDWQLMHIAPPCKAGA